MNRSEFRAAFRMARLVRGFEDDMSGRIRPGANSLADTVPFEAYIAARNSGDSLRFSLRRVRVPRCIAGPRGVLPA